MTTSDDGSEGAIGTTYPERVVEYRDLLSKLSPDEAFFEMANCPVVSFQIAEDDFHSSTVFHPEKSRTTTTSRARRCNLSIWQPCIFEHLDNDCAAFLSIKSEHKSPQIEEGMLECPRENRYGKVVNSSPTPIMCPRMPAPRVVATT